MTDGARSFAEAEARLITLYGAGEYDAALEVAASTAAAWPDRIAYTYFWTASLLAVKGDAAAAIAEFDSALSRDPRVWWSSELLRGDQDLASLQGVAGFEAVVEESERRGTGARASARVEWSVLPAAGERAGVLVALHGRTGNIPDSSEHWGKAVTADIDVVVVQSSQMVGFGMHCWDNPSRTRADIATAIEATAADDPLVLGGFSQGGGVACALALAQDPAPARGFLSVCPSFFRDGLTPEDMRALAPGASAAGVRGWMSIGADDVRYRPAAEEVAAALKEAGAPVTTRLAAGRGHEFPESFDAVLAEAVPFLLERPLLEGS